MCCRPFRWYREGKRKLPPVSIRRVPPFCNSAESRPREGGRTMTDRRWPVRPSIRPSHRSPTTATRSARCGPTPGATTSAGRRRPQRCSSSRAAGRPWRPSPRRPASASARSTATSPSGSTSSRPSTARTSTGSCPQPTSSSANLEPWPALVAWLEAFVRYANTKRTFLNELHEAFEKNPQLRISSRERIEAAIDLVLRPGAGRRCRAHRSRRV